jgi:hypothetical protein
MLQFLPSVAVLSTAAVMDVTGLLRGKAPVIGAPIKETVFRQIL